jgi:hypothetical protein
MVLQHLLEFPGRLAIVGGLGRLDQCGGVILAIGRIIGREDQGLAMLDKRIVVAAQMA